MVIRLSHYRKDRSANTYTLGNGFSVHILPMFHHCCWHLWVDVYTFTSTHWQKFYFLQVQRAYRKLHWYSSFYDCCKLIGKFYLLHGEHQRVPRKFCQGKTLFFTWPNISNITYSYNIRLVKSIFISFSRLLVIVSQNPENQILHVNQTKVVVRTSLPWKRLEQIYSSQ